MWAWGNGNGDVGGDYAPFDHNLVGGSPMVTGALVVVMLYSTNVGDSGDAWDCGHYDGDGYPGVDDVHCDLVKVGCLGDVSDDKRVENCQDNDDSRCDLVKVGGWTCWSGATLGGVVQSASLVNIYNQQFS